MRIKALLVDDEINILKNLQSVIPWEAMNVDIVGTARNGMQALELARRHQPHIVLCDIRMPVMDGIQFLEALREFDQEAVVLMMTGYQDFSYVRSVIRYDVKDYILKPIDYEELAQTIERLARDARDRSAERLQVQREWRRVFHLAYEKVLYDLLVGLEAGEPRSFFRLHDAAAEEPAFAMMLIDVADYSKKEHLWDEKERKLWNFAVQNILRECLASWNAASSVLQVRKGEWCVLIEQAEHVKFDAQQLVERAEALCSAVQRYLKLGIRASVHPEPVPIEQLSRAYKGLQRVLNLSPDRAEGVLFPDKDAMTRDASDHPLWDWIEDMVTGLKRCDRRRTETALKELNDSFRRLPESSFDRVEPILHYVCLHLLREMKTMNVLAREEEKAVWQQLDRNPGVRESLALINKLVDQSLDSVMKKKTSEVLMMSAKDFIERSLSLDLSIDMMAEYLGISGSYFSLLFKQHFGETFVEYVTRQRMEMAMSLLVLSDKSVTQIGKMVGYSERRYFTRVFSKYTGMLPSEFRAKHQNRDREAELPFPSWSS